MSSGDSLSRREADATGRAEVDVERQVMAVLLDRADRQRRTTFSCSTASLISGQVSFS